MSDEDPRQELERLERDLAAIDARWASEGYQQRTTSKVLDDERKTRRELARRIAELRGLPPPLTPAAGTVALNVGGAWRPLVVNESAARLEADLPLPAFDVTADADEAPPPLARLVAELHDLLNRAWELEGQLIPSSELLPMTQRYAKTPGAPRLLAAAWRSIGRTKAAMQVYRRSDVIAERPPREIKHLLLTQATELPDHVTGLTVTQASLMSCLRRAAPDTGPFVPATHVFAELQSANPEIDEATFTREVALLGHPSLRHVPLVAFQGFTGRFSAEPRFTHVRLTQSGREVIEGTFPLPNLLLNGARGCGACLLPMHPGELAKACLELLENRARTWPTALRGFDLPDGTQSSPYGCRRALWSGDDVAPVQVRARVECQRGSSDSRCRIVVSAPPWPLTFESFADQLSQLVADGSLDGVVALTDESSADAVRFAIELEHIAFLRYTEQKLVGSGLFDARYPVALHVAENSFRSLSAVVAAFIESRKEIARSRLDAEALRLQGDAQRAEAVCVALEIIDRVQSVLRETVTDAEGEEALMNCIRPEDREALARLPFPPSHDYARGFTLEQARHLLKKRKLATLPREAARTDWWRALGALEQARELRSADDEVFHVVRQEFRAAIERFGEEPRRSSFVY